MKKVVKHYKIYALFLLVLLAAISIPAVKIILAENIYIFSAYWLILMIEIGRASCRERV